MAKQKMKDRIDKLVDVFVSYATGVGEDAGWHGPHCLGMLIEYRGDIPPSSGNDRSDIQAINEIRFLRKKHAHFNLACMLLGRLARQHDKYVTALLAEPYLKHVYKRPFIDRQVAAEIGEALHRYQHNRKMGYQIVGETLQLIDEYEEARAA